MQNAIIESPPPCDIISFLNILANRQANKTWDEIELHGNYERFPFPTRFRDFPVLAEMKEGVWHLSAIILLRNRRSLFSSSNNEAIRFEIKIDPETEITVKLARTLTQQQALPEIDGLAILEETFNL